MTFSRLSLTLFCVVHLSLSLSPQLYGLLYIHQISFASLSTTTSTLPKYLLSLSQPSHNQTLKSIYTNLIYAPSFSSLFTLKCYPNILSV